MKTIRLHFKNFFQKFSTLPERMPEEYYRYYVTFNYFSFFPIFSHGSIIFTFWVLNIKFLSIFNIGSTIVWLLVFLLNFKGYLKTAFFTGMIEGLIHAIICTYVIGWSSGFHYFLILGALIIIIVPWMRNPWKVLLIVLTTGTYILMNYISLNYESVVTLTQAQLNFINYQSIIATFALIAIGVNYYKTAAVKAELALKKAHVETQSLLHNILPVSIADRLRDNPKIIADKFQNTTTLFSDIVGFTSLAEKMKPGELVSLLNDIIIEFDNIAGVLHLEKIKTIGDSYMVAAGLPEERSDHAEAIAEMAISMLSVMDKIKKTRNTNLQVRIGINSGPVIAGVIGKKKFTYDLWGDTVNIAARMESHGQPDTIQVSQNTYDLLKYKYVFKERGLIDIKGKGKMKTYFLLHKKNY